MGSSTSCSPPPSQLIAAPAGGSIMWASLLVLALVKSGLGDALLPHGGDNKDGVTSGKTHQSFNEDNQQRPRVHDDVISGNAIPDGPGDQPAFQQHLRTKPFAIRDPVFEELLDVENRNNSKRASWDFYNMIKCGTGCNPLVYKGYGCYCGFLGSGDTVDGIDMCCKMHDWCYTTTTCQALEYNLPYFVPYKWSCNGGAPYCIAGKIKGNGPGSCSHQLCECDKEFVHCLAEFPCPHKKAMCRSPWRYWQNLFMGLGTNMPVDDSQYAELHRNRPRQHAHQP